MQFNLARGNHTEVKHVFIPVSMILTAIKYSLFSTADEIEFYCWQLTGLKPVICEDVNCHASDYLGTTRYMTSLP